MAQQFYATKVYGFDPPTWGGLGFPKDHDLERALAELANSPENLVVHIGTNTSDTQPHDRGRLLGLTRLADSAVLTSSVLDPNAKHSSRWTRAIPFLEAWAFVDPPHELDLLPRFREARLDRTLGNTILPLQDEEWPALMSLPMTKVDVYAQQIHIELAQKNCARRILRDQRRVWRPPLPTAGKFLVERVDGPAFTYRAKLVGIAAEHFCRADSDAAMFKIGWTCDLDARASNLNFAMPDLEYLRWEVDWQYPHASRLEAETMEQEILEDLRAHRAARSGSQEVVLASEGIVRTAWQTSIMKRRYR